MKVQCSTRHRCRKLAEQDTVHVVVPCFSQPPSSDSMQRLILIVAACDTADFIYGEKVAKQQLHLATCSMARGHACEARSHAVPWHAQGPQQNRTEGRCTCRLLAMCPSSHPPKSGQQQSPLINPAPFLPPPFSVLTVHMPCSALAAQAQGNSASNCAGFRR